MLISPATFLIIRLIAGIILFTGCFYLIKERLGSTIKAVISIVAGVIGFTAVQFAFSKIYIIESDLIYEDFYIVGSTREQMGNGKTITVSAGNFNKVNVINKSRFKLILEEIIYADHENSVSSNGDYEIQPYGSSEVFLPGNEISYFFEEHIPDAVEVVGGSSKRYWLRLESQADNDDSVEEYE